MLLLTDHDRILEMKVDQHHDLVFTGLVNCVLDIGVHYVNDLIVGGDEAKTVGVRLQIPLRLAAGNHRSHGQVRKPGNTLVLCAYQLFLHDKIRLLLFNELLLSHALLELRELSERL
jgi:hypothetical protein